MFIILVSLTGVCQDREPDESQAEHVREFSQIHWFSTLMCSVCVWVRMTDDSFHKNLLRRRILDEENDMKTTRKIIFTCSFKNGVCQIFPAFFYF